MSYQLTGSELTNIWDDELRRTGSVYMAEQATKRAHQQATAGDKDGSAQRVKRARAAIDAAHKALAALAVAHMQERTAVEKRPVSHYNPDGHLTGQGVAEARRSDLATLTERDNATLANYREQIEQATKILLNVASAEAKPSADDIARRTAHWRRTESLLSSGRLPSQIVREATDPDELAALRDELPTRFRADSAAKGQPDASALRETDAVLHQIDARLAAMGDPQALARTGIAELPRIESTTAKAADAIQRGRLWPADDYALRVVVAGATPGVGA